MYLTAKIVQEKAVHEHLTDTYGNDFFSLDDLLRMEICDNGDVHIGFAIIPTGIAL